MHTHVLSFPGKCTCKELNKNTKTKIPRPKNAFIIFRQHQQHFLPPTVPTTEKSRIIGDMWKKLSVEEKSYWVGLSMEERRQHKLKYPNYQYYQSKTTNQILGNRKLCPLCKERVSHLASGTVPAAGSFPQLQIPKPEPIQPITTNTSGLPSFPHLMESPVPAMLPPQVNIHSGSHMPPTVPHHYHYDGPLEMYRPVAYPGPHPFPSAFSSFPSSHFIQPAVARPLTPTTPPHTKIYAPAPIQYKSFGQLPPPAPMMMVSHTPVDMPFPVTQMATMNWRQ